MASDTERDQPTPRHLTPNRNSRDLPAGLSFLVVEDEGILAWDIEELLTRNGAARVQLANSLVQARQRLQADDRIDFVIVDWKLPDGSGLDLAALLRKTGIPHLLITGYPLDQQTEGLPVLQKPFSSDKFLHAVKNEYLKFRGG